MKRRRARRAARLAAWWTLSALSQSEGIAMGQDIDPIGPAYRSLLCRAPDGRLSLAPTLPGADPDPGCRSLDLPVPPSSVRWVGALSRADSPGVDRLGLAGTGQGVGFEPSGASFAEPPGQPARPSALPLDQDLIPVLSARPFGVEERVTLSRTDDGITLHCRAGTKPAGLVLDPGQRRLPDEAQFALRWQVRGDPGFSAAHAGPLSEGKVAPLPADGTLDLSPSTHGAARDAPRFVLSCPARAASLTVDDLRLAPLQAARPSARSAWAWRSNRWREAPERLIAEALALGAERLFVTVAIEDGAIADEARFSDFVALARASGIVVAVVEGDPGMALDEGRAVAIRRLEALADYQRRNAGDGRLAGVQYDIEPYLLPGFQDDPERILRGWAAALDGLSATAAPLTLDLVLPFWLPLHRSAGLVLPTIARAAERVTVMAYRTTAAEILAAAEPMLAWSSAARRPLHVAVEAGPVGDETTRTYRRSATGELLVLPMAGHGALALLLRDPVTLRSADRLYAQERESVVAGSRVSFLGDRGRLDEAVAQLSRSCAAWPSFSGIALHGLIE